MKKSSNLLLFIFGISAFGYSQVGIGTFSYSNEAGTVVTPSLGQGSVGSTGANGLSSFALKLFHLAHIA